MAANQIIKVRLFGREIGRIGMEEGGGRSSFQFNPDYLSSEDYRGAFPHTGILKRTNYVQMFSQFDNDTFRGLPPQFADSLPDVFGSKVFKAWLDTRQNKHISVLEQLAYVGNRGMGAIEYAPSVDVRSDGTINLDEVIQVLQELLDLKRTTAQKDLNHEALLNIFKIGTSAGGARPKILISEEKETGQIIPGDLECSDRYEHYIVKLAIDAQSAYPREVVEYCYYQLATKMGIRMMDSKLIDEKHFATLRFDRQGGEKQHVLTACGMTGWDYQSPTHSSYENLFKLCSFLKVPHAQTEELFLRMVFNVLYGNTDDHLKNHSFIYSRSTDSWQLAPAYDLTYALNPLLDIKQSNRALSINGKRSQITIDDLLKVADDFTIKNPKGVMAKVASYKDELIGLLNENDLPALIIDRIQQKVASIGQSS